MRGVAFLVMVSSTVAMAADPFIGVPNVISVAPVDGSMESMGMPSQARLYRLKMKPLDAFRWCNQAFRKADLYIPPPQQQFQIDDAPQLTGYDPDARRSFTAVFKDNGDGTTTLIAATVDLSTDWWMKQGQALPVMPAAKQVLQSKSEQGVVQSFVVAATPAEVDGYYAEVLPKGGWQRDEARGAWVKRGQLLTLSQSAHTKSERAVVVTVRSQAADSARSSEPVAK